MERASDILARLGFKADAPVETQSAFLRHLLKAAGRQPPKGGEQLSFTFSGPVDSAESANVLAEGDVHCPRLYLQNIE